jgi:hypothetical protein
MLHHSPRNTVAIAALIFAFSAWAQTSAFGTAADARAMLERVVSAMQADPAKTISQINRGDGGFRDRDLYPTCAGPDGRNVAHPDPSRIGLVQRDIRDSTGKPYGAEFANAVEDRVTEVSYMFPRPGADTAPVRKVAFVTKVNGYICVVGYYEP